MRNYLLATLWLMGFLVVIPTASAFGYGSNLSLAGYPLPTCSKPWNKPVRPYVLDEYSVRRYNDDVDTYNAAIRRYNSCISEYLLGAENDVKKIQEEIQRAGHGSSIYSMVRYGHSNLLMGYPSAQEVCGHTRYANENDCFDEYKKNARKDIEDIILKVRLL